MNIGVVECNPGSTAGMVKALEEVGKFVPIKEDGKVMRMIVHGDQNSVERIWAARKARGMAEEEIDRMTWVIPSPQEFHKRGKLMEVNTVENSACLYTCK